jgi:hypothetical protein
MAGVMGVVEFDEDNIRVSTVHAVLWLHLGRKSRLAYGAIRKSRAVHSKLCELFGQEPPPAPQRHNTPREGAPILLSFCSFVEIL